MIKYNISLKEPVFIVDEHLFELTIISVSKDTLLNILKKEYKLDKNDFIINKEERINFSQNSKRIARSRKTCSDSLNYVSFYNPKLNSIENFWDIMINS